ncbi:MAG: triose-phosphate isomerase [Bacteroidetes bacterium]|nr:MAG: triose-phosphate isomerase [Bacteroidota bacterium]
MRKKIVAGNWKMNLDKTAGSHLISQLVSQNSDILAKCQVVICPPFPHLGYAASMVDNVAIALGAQNCSNKASGAYTGEVSAPILKSFDVEYVILGHSERREYFAESNTFLAEKVKQVLENHMTPIFCCGETLELRNQGNFVEFVCNQLTESLFDLSNEDFAKIVIAYEPIWAIGTGVTASTQQAQDMHFEIRKHLATKYGELAQKTSILYGGSCKASNAKELFACPDVDGGLIGGASLTVADFVGVIKGF